VTRHAFASSGRCLPARTARWLVVSVQAPHRFYNAETEATVGGWMTRLDREQLIVDNVDYVRDVVDQVRRTHATTADLVSRRATGGRARSAGREKRARRESGTERAGSVTDGRR